LRFDYLASTRILFHRYLVKHAFLLNILNRLKTDQFTHQWVANESKPRLSICGE